MKPLNLWCLAAVNGHGKWELRAVTALYRKQLVEICPQIEAFPDRWKAVKVYVTPSARKP